MSHVATSPAKASMSVDKTMQTLAYTTHLRRRNLEDELSDNAPMSGCTTKPDRGPASQTRDVSSLDNPDDGKKVVSGVSVVKAITNRINLPNDKRYGVPYLIDEDAEMKARQSRMTSTPQHKCKTIECHPSRMDCTSSLDVPQFYCPCELCTCKAQCKQH